MPGDALPAGNTFNSAADCLAKEGAWLVHSCVCCCSMVAPAAPCASHHSCIAAALLRPPLLLQLGPEMQLVTHLRCPPAALSGHPLPDALQCLAHRFGRSSSKASNTWARPCLKLVLPTVQGHAQLTRHCLCPVRKVTGRRGGTSSAGQQQLPGAAAARAASLPAA